MPFGLVTNGGKCLDCQHPHASLKVRDSLTGEEGQSVCWELAIRTGHRWEIVYCEHIGNSGSRSEGTMEVYRRFYKIKALDKVNVLCFPQLRLSLQALNLSVLKSATCII